MKYLVAIVLMLLFLALMLSVQAWARRFAARHPEFGPAREEGKGCGGCGGQCSSHCQS